VGDEQVLVLLVQAGLLVVVAFKANFPSAALQGNKIFKVRRVLDWFNFDLAYFYRPH